MDYGKRITELMEKQGLTQYRMSKLTGIAQSQIGRYMHGTNKPGSDALQKICDGLGVSIAEFFLPEPFDVTIEGEIVPLSSESQYLKEAANELQDMTDEELKLIKNIARTIKDQRK